MYDYVDAKIRLLDADLRRFDAELAQDRRRAGLPVSLGLSSTTLLASGEAFCFGWDAGCWVRSGLQASLPPGEPVGRPCRQSRGQGQGCQQAWGCDCQI